MTCLGIWIIGPGEKYFLKCYIVRNINAMVLVPFISSAKSSEPTARSYMRQTCTYSTKCWCILSMCFSGM